jgi:ABC-type branched-subunit amino acid transport system substrate-binding protein
MRHALLFGLAGALLACFCLCTAPGKGRAQEPQSAGGGVFVGINVPLSGPYKAQGQDEKRAYRLAIDRINENGGLLGRRITFEIKDTSADPEQAKQNIRELVRAGNASMITGGVSSEVAIAQSDLCQELGVLYMAALAHSSAVTGFVQTPSGFREQKAHRNTFRWFFNDWMSKEALTPYLIERFGANREYYYISVDYIWGDTILDNLQYSTETKGCMTAGSVRTSLGKRSFKRELARAKNTGPDILVLNLFGRDLATALSQAEQMGLTESTQLVAPLMDINVAREVGPEIMQNVISTSNWYWSLQDSFAGSKEFVSAYRNRYNKVPSASAAAAWVAVMQWASAVERAGTFETSEVILELENHSFNLLKGRETWRAWDHQAVSSVYVVRGKSESESNGRWDLLTIVKKHQGKGIVRNKEQNTVKLEELGRE